MSVRPEEIVARWLVGDEALREEAVEWATGDEFTYGDMALGSWATDLLYDTAYGNSLPDLHWIKLSGASVEAAEQVRALLSSHAVAGCHWATVRGIVLKEGAR